MYQRFGSLLVAVALDALPELALKKTEIQAQGSDRGEAFLCPSRVLDFLDKK